MTVVRAYGRPGPRRKQSITSDCRNPLFLNTVLLGGSTTDKLIAAAVKLGATTVLVPACTRQDCVAGRVDEDLRWLARQAASRKLRIAYEGMAWSTVHFTLAAAWECVRRLNEPNLGLAVDVFHIFVRGRTASDLDGIPMERIFLVQLSDLNGAVDLDQVVEVARHRRLLPGRGRFPIGSVLTRLKAAGYAGPIGVEVFNDELKLRDPQDVAREAMSALRQVWAP